MASRSSKTRPLGQWLRLIVVPSGGSSHCQWTVASRLPTKSRHCPRSAVLRLAQAASQPACYGSMLRFPNRSLLLVANSAANSPLSSAAAHWPAQADLASEPCRRRATAIAASAALWAGPQGAGSAELARLRVDTGSARSWRAFPAWAWPGQVLLVVLLGPSDSRRDQPLTVCCLFAAALGSR